MNKFVTLSAAAIVAVAASISAVPVTFAQMNHNSMPTGEMSDATKSYMDAMTRMDQQMAAMEMTGKPSADFVMMMIPHHQSAIDMAKGYLDSGDNDPELTKLSNDIIAAQETEIAFLQEWLRKNGQ